MLLFELTYGYISLNILIKGMFMKSLLFFCLISVSVFAQTGTFNFTTATENGETITQTVSGVTLSTYSDHSVTPFPSMTLQDWSAYPPFDGNVATMNGQSKPSLSLIFSQPVNIASLLVADFFGLTDYDLLFTPNTGASKHQVINGYIGSVVTLNFIGITSIVVTNNAGGNICLGVDNIVMNASLPVELTTFSAVVVGDNINLNWQTATEVNNVGFEIERATTLLGAGLNVFEKIGFVKGAGNSNSPKTYSFIDKPTDGKEFKYRLKQIDVDGKYEYSKEIEVNINAPKEFSVKQNYPNPFNPSTKIEFSIPSDNKVEIKLFDVLGKEVATLLNEYMQAGSHYIEFNASKYFNGIYFYKITCGNFSETKKMILLR